MSIDLRGDQRPTPARPVPASSEARSASSLMNALRARRNALGISEAEAHRQSELILAGGEAPAAKRTQRPTARLEQIASQLDTLADDLRLATAPGGGSNSTVPDLAQLVAQVQGLTAEISTLARPADRARAWRRRQPKRGHKRVDWIWAGQGVKNNGGMDGNARAKFIARAKWWNRLRRAPGEHKGPLRASGIEVLESLLYDFQNRKTGDCFPSLAKIADRIGRSESVVAKAIQRLAAAKLIFIVPRRDRGVRRDGRKLPIVVSNAYVFPPTTENTRGTGVVASSRPTTRLHNAASPSSGDLRSPAATAAAAQYGPPELQMPY